MGAEALGGARVVQSHEELNVYQLAFEAATQIFHLSKAFPQEEKFSLNVGNELRQTYDHIIGKLVNMIINPAPWVLKGGKK